MPGHLVPRTWQYDPTLDAPAVYKRACQYEAFVPDELASLSVQLDAQLAGLVSEAEHAIRVLNDEAGPALDPLARLLLRTESIASSKVEGLQLGVRELARAEAKAESGSKPSPTAMELLANIDAMLLAVDEAATVERFGVTEITAVHRRLLERAPHQHIAGHIRTQQNWIGGNDYNPCGADFIPPPPEDLARLLADICASINNETLSPLVQAALVHAQFETVHPFDGGNGRTGRALVHVVLHRRGIAPRFLPPISVVFAGSRDRYIAGLTAFRGDGVAAWIEHFAAATVKAARLARAYIDAVRAMQERWRQQLRATDTAPRADAAAWTIIDLLPAHPMISAPVATAVTGRARGRIYEAIEQLVTAGVLLPLSAGRRNRWWEAVGLLDLIGQVEAGEVPPPAA
ncbi:MAG: Fic family protein [Gemmatimonadota bacterium]|nr:Fic family protein [Gemmatimonadota bacterium]